MVQRLYNNGVTANQVTVLAGIVSVLVGAVIAWFANHPWIFVLVPIWMILRMALNAVDGMLAREFGQQSHLGAYLNELCDIIADAALILPFCPVCRYQSVARVVGHAVGAVQRIRRRARGDGGGLCGGMTGRWARVIAPLCWACWRPALPWVGSGRSG
nr:hypothetical protein GCM10020185_43390 [Pseudomonas brassicacearum subsp. brassicacearum]